MAHRQHGIGQVPGDLEKLDPDGFLQQARRVLIDIVAGRIAGAVAGSGSSGGLAGPPGPAGPPADTTPDLTPPPTPSGVTVTAGLDFVFITTDPPVFTMGHGYGRTVVYGAKYGGTGPLPTFSNAVVVHEYVGQVGSFPSEPATQWHIWVKWRTNDGVESVSPAGGANGFQVTTGVDVSNLLRALTGSIRQSELFAALSDQINLISAADTVPGSVNARIKTEEVARISAVSAVATSVTTVNARLNSGGDSYTAIVLAQTTASAKSATFVQATAPTATRINDTWIDTANGRILMRWDGAAWVATDDTRIGVSASSITTLQSQIAGSTGSGLLSQVQTEVSTRASETGYLGAQYSVRVALTNGGRTVQGGFGLMGTSGGAAGPTIDFGVLANRFYVGAPVGSTGIADVLPFIIQTTPTTINGQAVPIGVYIDELFVRNGSMTSAKIGLLQVTTGHIVSLSASKIVAGTIAVGEYIQSTGYVAGVSGWRMDGSGALNAVSGSFASSTSGKRITINEGGNNEALFYGDRGDGTVEVLADIGISPDASGFAIGIFGSTASSRVGVIGKSASTTGVSGRSGSGNGVEGSSTSSFGVTGFSASWHAVYGESASANPAVAGVLGSSNLGGIGVQGSSVSGIGVLGTSNSTNPAHAAVRGESTSGQGVIGVSTNRVGVEGYSSNFHGVYGTSVAVGHGGVFIGNGTRSALFLSPVATPPSNVDAGSIAVITGTTIGVALCYADGATWRRVRDGVVWNA